MTPTALGAHPAENAGNVTFRARAPSASRLEVWIYAAPTGAEPISREVMVALGDGLFELAVALSRLTTAPDRPIYYGYRAWGPNWPYETGWEPGSEAGFIADVDAEGHRYNPNKLLLDPYAREVSHCVRTPAQPDRTPYLSGAANRRTDTGAIAPKGIVLPPMATDKGPTPTRHLKDDIIYEVHVRGFTKTDPMVPEALRGTYAGAALRAAYLRDLGITAVEFQPVCQTQNALNDIVERHGDHNYWGYQSMSYMAPDRRYAADQSPGGPTREWIAMVKAFHDVGIKVFIDVVYNHHEEGGVDPQTGTIGAIYSLRGLDNVNYYETMRALGKPQRYADNNGVGPNLNAASRLGRDLVVDSLAYWSRELGVDGFRFDLGAVLGNACIGGGFSFDADDPDNILNRALALMPERATGGGKGIDLIAEPYTASGPGWELGRFPRGWAEWNTFFRDTIRASQNKLGVVDVRPAELMMRIAGSQDLFGTNGRAPWASINFVTCHDGFCLRDLHTRSDRNNLQSYPFGPSDGGNSAAQEMCWDHGGDPAQQMQATRTSLALVMLAAGVPMISGGSELHRTQHGNDNAYNVDTRANWFDWTLLDQNPGLFAFTRALAAFRHAHPCLRPAGFFTGRPRGGSAIKDLTWLRADGVEIAAAYHDDPGNHFLAWQIDGAAAGDPAPRIYVAYNGWVAPIQATLPPLSDGLRWHIAIDTSASAESWLNAYPAGEEPAIAAPRILVEGRSVVVAIAA